MSKHLIAVYGSLRQGFGNHRIIQEYPLVTTGAVRGYYLYDVAGGAFPAVTPGHGQVQVEVYEVDDAGLEAVDRLEGHPVFYERQVEEVVSSRAVEPNCTAWLYVQTPDQIGNNDPFIGSGDWAQYKGVA